MKSQKIKFNPNDKNHVMEYAHFMKYGSWQNGCKFALEAPYFNIPTMVQHKLMQQFMKKYTDRV
jgi:hypothetical protein